MFPALVPFTLGHFGADPVDGFVGAGEGVHVWSEADDGGVEFFVSVDRGGGWWWRGILSMERYVCPVCLSSPDAVEIPEPGEAGEEGTWDGAEGGGEGFVEG